VPTLHLTADRDLIAPPQTAASGKVVAIPSGHVGMIVGSARSRLHAELEAFLKEQP
jgi:polyhydroxyalkanoate synthase